jgi:hypothetical protein
LKFRRNVLSIVGVEVDRCRIFFKNIPKVLADYGVTSQKTVFLDAIAKLRKATISFVMSVCPSVRIEQLAPHRKDFHEICYLIIL